MKIYNNGIMGKNLEPFLGKFDATDIIAIVIILGGFVLLAMGIDTVVGGVITMVAGFYFGRKADGSKKK